VVERHHLADVSAAARGEPYEEEAPERAAFLVDGEIVAGSQLQLSEADARHINVLRLVVGDRVALRDGRGGVASGLLVRLGRAHAMAEVERVTRVAAPAAIHLLVPVADRDRMLWLAEKAGELNVRTWRPVLWRRSRSVQPRGDGLTFRGKVRARMVGALLQSRSAWLPEMFPEAPPDRAVASAPDGTRVVLQRNGVPLASVAVAAPVVLAVGPEGGFERAELELLADAGFLAVSLGASVLRFETAAIAGVAIAASVMAAQGGEVVHG